MINQDADLDQQLTDLFAAPGLSLRPSSNATAVIVTRARRRRRRRAATQVAGSIAAVGLLSAGILQARSLGQPVPPANSISGPALGGELVMSGSSVGPLRLGMSRAQAEATGLLVTPPNGSGCVRYTGKGHRGIITVRVGSAGVSSIEVYTFIRTPQGAGVGDSYAKLQATYPSALPESPDGRTSYRVPVPGQVHAWYVFNMESADTSNTGRPATTTRQTRVMGLTLQGPAC